MTDPSHRSASAPVPMPGARIVSPAGWRARGGGRREWHEGADFRAAVGTPVLAVRPGVVHAAMGEHERGIRGYGNLVVLWHPQDHVFTAYAHLSEMRVARGELVFAATVIGASGVTSGGRHLGMCPHLHFAVRGPRDDGRAPWPGPYPHPERAPNAHRRLWVDPVDYLRGFGLEPSSARGAGELRIRPASAADAGGGRPYPPRCPTPAITTAGAWGGGGALPQSPPASSSAPAAAQQSQQSGGDGARGHAPGGSGSAGTGNDATREASLWPLVLLVGGVGAGAVALASSKSKGRSR